MADPIEDREAEAHEGNVLVAGDVLAVGVPDEEVGRLGLEPSGGARRGRRARRAIRAGSSTARISSVMRGSKALPGVPVTTYWTFMSRSRRNSASGGAGRDPPASATRLP